MEEETQIVTRAENDKRKARESHILSVSIRGIIVLMLVGTVCYMGLKALKVEEPLYSLVFLAVGYYFGQSHRDKPKTQQQ